MRTITHVVRREGQYGPYYIVNFNNSEPCIVAEKNVKAGIRFSSVRGTTLEEFAMEGTKVKFSNGNKEIIGGPQFDPQSVILDLVARVHALEAKVSFLERTEGN